MAGGEGMGGLAGQKIQAGVSLSPRLPGILAKIEERERSFSSKKLQGRGPGGPDGPGGRVRGGGAADEPVCL